MVFAGSAGYWFESSRGSKPAGHRLKSFLELAEVPA
jgi:hypothetical protein